MTLLAALSSYTLLGQWVLYFDIDPLELGLSLATCSVLDTVLCAVRKRRLEIPLSGVITGLSIGLILESHDLRVFAVAGVWAVLSKYLVQVDGRHVFNPSNFAIVAALVLGHGTAVITPGSQWGNDFAFPVVILVLGSVMMVRVGRLPAVLGWLGAFLGMGALRVALGQGGWVFTLGPMTGADFALFSFSMLPDPKTSPRRVSTQLAWGFGLGICDGLLRLAEVKYSMFYALFVFSALRPWAEKAGDRLRRPMRRPDGDPAAMA